MRRSGLERKLVAGVVALFLVPALLAGTVLFFLYRRGVLDDPSTLALTILIGFVVLMVYLAVMAHGIGRQLVRTLQEIQLGAELIATVNPDHRLAVPPGDELGALAAEINRMADHLIAARRGLEGQVARATRELSVERGKLSAVIESLGEGVVVATAEGRIILANRAAQDRLGAASTGLLGRSLFDFVDREKVAHFLARPGIVEGRAERFSLHPGSGGAVLETVMTAFFDDERRPIGFVLVLRDVTSPARWDEERQRVLGELLRNLRERVASVRSLSESLLGDPAVGGSPVHRRLLEALHADALRLSGLVTDLDSPGRPGLSRVPWHFEELAVEELAAMAIRRLGERGASVRVEAPSALPALRAEASAFSLALAHLGAAVLARREPGQEVSLQGTRRGRLVQLEVGAPGAAPVAELEAALDEPVPVGGGRLAVREVVRQHAGEVWAFAEAGRLGFAVTLPGAEPREAATAGEASSGFVGAGFVSGVGADQGGPERPEFYDFSLFDEMERHLRPADRAQPLAALTFVAFDTETTGLAPEAGDRIVSLAGVRVRAGVVKRAESFDALVNPGRPIPDASVRFHGITDAMVAGAPPLAGVLPAFVRFAEGAVLVGHQVWFDLRFLALEARRLGLPPPTVAQPALDTLALSEVVHGPLPGHGLDAIAARLGVTVRGRHSALGDALAAAEILVRLVPLLEKRGIRTLGEALDAVRRARGARPADVPARTGP